MSTPAQYVQPIADQQVWSSSQGGLAHYAASYPWVFLDKEGQFMQKWRYFFLMQITHVSKPNGAYSKPTSRSDRIYPALWHDRLVLSDLCGNCRGLVIIPPRALQPSLKLHLPRFP